MIHVAPSTRRLGWLILLTASTIFAQTAPTTAESKDDGQWTLAGKNPQMTRYSGLADINTGNVKDLRLAWSFSTGVLRGHEEAPLVVGSTMYVVTPYPNILYALDLTKDGQMKWKYEPKPAAAAQGVACCDVVCRGCSYADGKIFFNTLDCHTIAVDAQTGKELWRTQVGDINHGETTTMCAFAVKGKVFVGVSGGEMGVRGWMKALDQKDGHVVWTAWSTGPDKDCLITDKTKPFYPMDQGKDLGVTTWPPEQWKIGGGCPWGFVTYDPESNTIYYGTSNPGCWNPELRPGDNKWGCTVFARDADTGEAKWMYQVGPHDLFDHDGINESIVLDLTIDGKPRKCIVRPDRDGYIYVMDRLTGEILSATVYERNTCIKQIDLKTGRLIPVEEKKPQTGKVIRDIQPASPGAKDWQPAAYSPRTGYLYIPHQNLSMDYEAVQASYIEGTPYVGSNVKMYAGADDPDKMGYYTCWDLQNKKVVWRKKEMFPCWSGTFVTAGDVCFYGTMDGWFKALDAKTGDELWKQKLDSGICCQPTTYRGPDGKQYVAVVSGPGGWAGAIVAGGLDARDPTAALGFVNAMRELPKYTTKGGTLYVFCLP